VAVVAKIGSPIALGTALLFYFGWVRADAQARALGYDVTLLGLSTSDYVLRSVSVLFLPIVLLLVVALACYLLHPRLLRWLANRAPNRARLLIAVLKAAWLWCPLLGMVIFVTVPQSRPLLIPLSLTAGILLAIYGNRCDRQLHAKKPARSAVTALALVLLAVVVFWDVERIASLTGQGFAEYIAAQPSQFAKITIFSAKRLELTAPGVSEKAIGTDASAYRFRYDGLRLLLHSDGKHFLLAYGSTGASPTVIVLPDNDQLRVEFSR
jgi:hypothetical protein